METKDIITLAFSSLASILSVSSLVISLRQKKKENTRALRKHLSDTINDIAQVSVALAKLKIDTKEDLTNDVIDLRRSYNVQRGALLNLSDSLINENPSLPSEIHFNIMANNWNSIGNYPKAEEYWKRCIEKSEDLLIKHMNLRGYATYLFLQGKMEAGRSKFNEALILYMPDTENVKRIISDTYIMWARIERDYKFTAECNRLVELAKSTSGRISHRKVRQDAEKNIELFLAEN